MSDTQFREMADRIEARRLQLARRLPAIVAAGERFTARQAFWCPSDDVDTWNPDSQVSRQYLTYLAGGQDPRD